MSRPCLSARCGLILLLLLPGVVVGNACAVPAADSRRIVVAGGSLTEIIYRLGLESQLVAVDTTSTYPAAAASLPSIGYVRGLSAEGVLSLAPTLILGEHDMGPPAVLAQLASTGIEQVIVPERFNADGIAAKVQCVLRVLGEDPADHQEVLDSLRVAADRLASAVRAQSAGPRTLVLLGLRDGAPVAAGAGTSGDGLLQMAGLTNVFAAMDGWKPVSLEALAAAEPQLIVIPERGLKAAGGIEALLAHPALRLTPAARARRVISMDGMALLGFGPRTLTAALTLAEAAGEQQERAGTL